MTTNHYDWVWGGALPTLLRHSAVKHSLLRDYLVDYFLTLVASPHQDRIQLTVIDGFCGGGRYVNEFGQQVPGSPVVILEAIKEARARVMHEQQRRKGIEFDVQLICVDESAAAIDHLRNVLEEEGYGKLLRNAAIKLIAGEFLAQAQEVIAEAQRRSPKAGRAIFVLDQYGYDKVPLALLRDIFQSLRRAEVILTFNIDSLVNFLCEKNLIDFERKTGITGAVSAVELDKEQRGPGWRLKIQSGLYQRLTSGSGAGFFTPFFIRPERGHGDFWLLHLSQHWKARDVMANAHWQHNNHFVHYGAPGFNMLSAGYAARIDGDDRPQAAFDFDDAASVASNDALLLEIPMALGAHPQGVSFDRFFLERLNSTPCTKDMVESTILQLVRDRQVEVVGIDGSSRNVRTAIKSEHVLRLPAQRPMVFL